MRLDLDGLAAASREALRAEWREVVGRPPPKHLSKPLMVQILSHAYQLDTVGGYTKRLDSRLRHHFIFHFLCSTAWQCSCCHIVPPK